MGLVGVLALALSAVLVPGGATRVAVPGGLYADCRPSGEIVVSLPGRVQMQTGSMAAPDTLLFPRLPESGVIKIAGKAHTSNTTWVWEAGQWRADGRTSHGVQGHIWRPDGTLFVFEPCTNCESQGIRYWDNGPVWGSPTYDSGSPLARSLGVTRLFGWTYRNGIAVGQGEIGGAVIQANGVHRLIEPGDTQFIQFHLSGERGCVAMSKFREQQAVVVFFALSDVAAWPVYPLTPEEPTDPEPEPQEPASLLADVQAERAKVEGQPTPAQLGAMLNAIAWKHRDKGWGLSRKDGGNKCPMPAPAAIWIACDILHHRPTDQLYDVFGSAEAGATPRWAKAEHHNNPNRPWVAPVAPTTEPDEPDVPEPDTSALTARVVALEAALADLHGMVVMLDRAVVDAQAEIDALKRRPDNGVPRDEVLRLIEAALIDLYVEGGTSRSWGHSHSINLPIKRR